MFLPVFLASRDVFTDPVSEVFKGPCQCVSTQRPQSQTKSLNHVAGRSWHVMCSRMLWSFFLRPAGTRMMQQANFKLCTNNLQQTLHQACTLPIRYKDTKSAADKLIAAMSLSLAADQLNQS